MASGGDLFNKNKIMPEGYRKKMGEFGEKLAGDFLKRRGYEIVLRNYYTRFGEIDIIAQKEGRWFFIEVKTRTNEAFGEPQEAVTHYKIRRLSRAVEIYLLDRNLQRADFQIDVIGVAIDRINKKAKIKHWPGVF
jgi:putative endonuclease